MYVTDFEYANKRLSDMGYIMCHINTDSGIREVDVGCDITFNTVKNNHSSVRYITSSSYDNVYTTTFEIIKNTCGKANDSLSISESEMRSLMVWLNRREYRKMKFINNVNSSMNISYYGSFNVKQIMNGDEIIGLSLVFTSNAPYGFGDNIHLEYNIESVGDSFAIYGDGDELGIVYPQISIKCKESGNLKIANITTGKSVYIENCLQDETIYINVEHKIIMTDSDKHATLSNDFNYEYFDIQIDDDDYSENIYEVSLPCVITVDYCPTRKVGVN